MFLRLTTLAFSALLLSSCGGSGGSSSDVSTDTGTDLTPQPDPDTPAQPTAQTFEELVTADQNSFQQISSRSLEADGEGIGLTAYELVGDFGGPNPIESPDLYAINHPGSPHIYEDLDQAIGEHFVFVIHRDQDIDRDRVENDDRQRNEIKTYGGSEEAVKGFEDETLIFTWKFKVYEDMEVSTRFTHLFQLKAVGAEDSHPIVTFTVNEQSSSDGMEVRHSPLQIDTDLARIDWDEFTGHWLNAYVRATFADDGDLRIIVERMTDGEILFDIDETNIDMWRGEENDHFVRPKWGIYRSIAEPENLRAEEEIVRFANFEVNKVQAANP